MEMEVITIIIQAAKCEGGYLWSTPSCGEVL